MSVLAAVLMALAVLLWRPPGSARLAGLRLAGLRLTAPFRRDQGVRTAHDGRVTGVGVVHGNDVRAHARGRGRFRLARSGASGLAGAAVAVLCGGGIGVVFGGVVGGLTIWLLGRVEPAAVRERRRRLTADLPLAADLLATCLRAGQPPERSIQAVAVVLDGPLGEELGLVATGLRLGAEPRAAWSGFLAEPALASFGRAMARSASSGLPPADLLERLAQDARRSHRNAAERRAHTVGVHAAAPLGLCFLPAFVLVGIVPIVAAALGTLLE